MTHPFAFVPNKSGACGMKAGDRVRITVGEHKDKCGIADEFLQDGDAYLTMDDGTFLTTKWNHLVPA